MKEDKTIIGRELDPSMNFTVRTDANYSIVGIPYNHFDLIRICREDPAGSSTKSQQEERKTGEMSR